MRSMAGYAIRRFPGCLQGFSMAAFEVVRQYPDMAFTAKLRDVLRRRNPDKSALVRHGKGRVPRVAAVAALAGYIILSVPACLPGLNDRLKLGLHGIRCMTGDAQILFDLFPGPGLCQKTPLKLLTVSRVARCRENKKSKNGYEYIFHRQILPQNNRTTHRMRRNMNTPRRIGLFRTFFSR